MSIEAILGQASRAGEIVRNQEVIDGLIGRIRCMLGIGLSGAEIMDHFPGEDPELLFLAYQGAKLLDSEVSG